MAGAPLATYAANHETYRDPQTGPTVPNAMGQKRKFSFYINKKVQSLSTSSLCYPEQPIMGYAGFIPTVIFIPVPEALFQFSR